MTDLSNVMRIDFTVDYGYKADNLLALFNINKISEDEVNKFIHGYYKLGGTHPDIIVMSPEQFESVFGKEEV